VNFVKLGIFVSIPFQMPYGADCISLGAGDILGMPCFLTIASNSIGTRSFTVITTMSYRQLYALATNSMGQQTPYQYPRDKG